MVNGLGNLLSFVDTNVSSNSSSYNLNNYSYDDSFANMLNKTQTEDIYSAPSSVSNKTVERYTDTDKAYAENNYSSYDDYNTSSVEDKLSSEENTVKVADNSSNNAEEKSKLTNAEEKAFSLSLSGDDSPPTKPQPTIPTFIFFNVFIICPLFSVLKCK